MSGLQPFTAADIENYATPWEENGISIASSAIKPSGWNDRWIANARSITLSGTVNVDLRLTDEGVIAETRSQPLIGRTHVRGHLGVEMDLDIPIGASVTGSDRNCSFWGDATLKINPSSGLKDPRIRGRVSCHSIYGTFTGGFSSDFNGATTARISYNQKISQNLNVSAQVSTNSKGPTVMSLSSGITF